MDRAGPCRKVVTLVKPAPQVNQLATLRTKWKLRPFRWPSRNLLRANQACRNLGLACHYFLPFLPLEDEPESDGLVLSGDFDPEDSELPVDAGLSLSALAAAL